MPALSLSLSLSVSVNGKVIACYHHCQAIVDTGSSLLIGPTDVVSSIQRHINPNPIGDSKVKGHATKSFLGSPNTKDHLGQPLSLFFLQQMMSCSDATNPPPVTFTISGTDFPGTPKYYIQKVRVHPWGLVAKSGTCWKPWAAPGRRAPPAGQATPLTVLPSSVAGPVLPTNQPLERRGPSGRPIILK